MVVKPSRVVKKRPGLTYTRDDENTEHVL